MKHEPESFQKGYLLALDNAQSLLKIADQSAAMTEYGIARSLSILSAEEAIKACFCLHKCHYPDMLLDKEIFYSHLSKHKHIETHLWTFVYVPTRFIRILEQEGFKEDSTFCTFLANFIKKVDDDFSEPGDLKAAEIRDWNKSANKKKNDGLYVGLNRDNGIWHDPRSLTQRDYEADRRFSAKMIELALKFDELHIKWKALR
jgi:AbiV family abortive infection protein